MKKIIFTVVIICLISASFAFMRDQKPRYENLKVLSKNTTKQEMDSVMRHFSASLGVKCTYCHVRETTGQKNFNFASDDNENKLIARNMYKMMNKINNKYFKKDDNDGNGNRIPAISCYSCHHGKEDPENRPPAPPQNSPQGQPSPPPAQPGTPPAH